MSKEDKKLEGGAFSPSVFKTKSTTPECLGGALLEESGGSSLGRMPVNF